MISAVLRRNKDGCIYGFTIINHGTTDACAAVSLLTLNTANGLEALTDEVFNCEYNPEGGFLQVELPSVKDGHKSPQANLLLETMALGLYSVQENYSSELEILEQHNETSPMDR